jgi:hypothetical protein
MSNKKKYIGEVEEAKADNSALKVNQGIEQPPQVNPNFRKFKRIKKDLTVSDYVEGIVAGDVNILSQAISFFSILTSNFLNSVFTNLSS